MSKTTAASLLQRSEASQSFNGSENDDAENSRSGTEPSFHCSYKEVYSWGKRFFNTLCPSFGCKLLFGGSDHLFYCFRSWHCGIELLKCFLGLLTTRSQSIFGLWAAYLVGSFSSCKQKSRGFLYIIIAKLILLFCDIDM